MALTLTSPEVRSKIEEQYPAWVWLIDEPSLIDFWNEVFAAEERGEPLSGNEFASRLWATEWFRTRSDSARLWDKDVQTDPGDAQRRIEARTVQLSNRAATWGIELSDTELQTLVETSLRWDLTNEEINAALAAFAKTPSKVRSGSLTSTAAQIRGIARSYWQDLSDVDAREFARQVLAGRLTLEAVQARMRDQAKVDLPHLSDDLDNLNVNQLTAGMRSRLASLFDVDASSIDLRDTRFSHLIDSVDPESGERRMATYSEVQRWGRQQREFRQSAQGNREAAQLVGNLLRVTGAIG